MATDLGDYVDLVPKTVAAGGSDFGDYSDLVPDAAGNLAPTKVPAPTGYEDLIPEAKPQAGGIRGTGKTFGLNMDGSVDATDVGRMSEFDAHHGAFKGIDLRNPELEAMAIGGRQAVQLTGIKNPAKAQDSLLGQHLNVTNPATGQVGSVLVVDKAPFGQVHVEMTPAAHRLVGSDGSVDLEITGIDGQNDYADLIPDTTAPAVTSNGKTEPGATALVQTAPPDLTPPTSALSPPPAQRPIDSGTGLLPSPEMLNALKRGAEQPLIGLPPTVGKFVVENLPLINLAVAAGKQFALERTEQITTGSGKALADTFSGLTSPQNVVLLSTLAGAPALVSRAVGLGFSAQAAHSMYEQSKQLESEPDPARRAELFTSIFLNGAIATAAGVHGLSQAEMPASPAKLPEFTPETPVKVARASASFTGARLGDLRLAARDWARANLQGREFQNGPTGDVIQVANTGVEKITSGARSQEHFQSVTAIPDLLQNAIRTETHRDLKGNRPDIVAVHRYVAPLDLEGKIFRAKLTVFETKDGRKLYDHSLTEIESPTGFRERQAADPHSDQLGAAPAVGDTITLGELQHDVKKSETKDLNQAQNDVPFGFGPGAASVAENLAVAPQIRQLTETIGKELATPRPGGVSGRVKRAVQTSGGKLVGARQAIGRGLNSVRATWLALKNGYLRPPAITDYRESVKDWQAADQRTSFEARQFVQKIRETIKDSLTREAITNYIQADGDLNLLRQRAAASNLKYAPGYEAATKLTPAQITLAANIRQYFDGMLQDGINAGILSHGIDNYINQVWKRPNKITRELQAAVDTGKLQTSFQFARQRIFGSFFEGEQAGYEPAAKDVSALVAAYDIGFNRALAARGFVKALRDAKASDGEPVVKFSGMSQAIPANAAPPEAYLIRSRSLPESAATADGRPYLPVDHPALRGWKLSVQEGAEAKTFYQADMLVHPEVAANLRRVLGGSAFRQGTLGFFVSPLLKVGAVAKQTKLSLSVFHLDQEGLHGIFHRINPTNIEQLDFNNPTQYALVRGGLQVADYHAMELFSEGLRGGGLVSKIPVLGKLQNRFNEFLFKDYIPRLKMTMALHAYERNLGRYDKQFTPDQIAEITASQANAAFGELNYKLLGRSASVQDFMRLTLLAPDFLEARTRFVGQALKPYGAEQRAAIFLMGATLYAGSRIFNQLLDGEPHWDKPFSVVYNGREYRLRTVIGDVFEFGTDPRRFFYNRFSPWLKTAVTVGTGRDYRGLRLTNWEQVKDVLSWMVPIPFGGSEPANLTQRLLGSSGVSNKPSATAVNEMYDAARTFRDNLADPKAKAEVARAKKEVYAESDYRRLSQFLRENDRERAISEMVRLMVEQGKPPETMNEYYSNLPTRPFSGSQSLEARFLDQLDNIGRLRYQRAIQERQQLAQRFGDLIPYAIRSRDRQ